MEPWIKYTNGKEQLAKLAAWRMYPSADTLAALPEFLRPTQLQLSLPHPAVIDWCIFPFLRNKLIEYHRSDPALDEICGDIGMAYVVQACFSELVANEEPLMVYIRVCDVIAGMENNPALVNPPVLGTNAQVKLPAPSLHTLLHTKEYAREMYRHFTINDSGKSYYLDPELFNKYPHLYEPNAKIAQGMPLRPYNKISWPHPHPLDNIALNCYLGCASYHLTQPQPRLALEGH